MEIKSLQKKTLLRSGTHVLIIIGLVSIAFYLSSVQTKIQEKHDWLKNDITSLNRKIEGLDAKALEFNEATKLWERFSEEQKQLQGLRIDYAKNLLDKSKDEYKLTGVNISFSKPDELKDAAYVTDTVAVMSSDVSVDFKGITDDFILNFVASIIADFPGYVQINSLSITRTKEVAKEDLEKISKGDYAGLIDGKVVFSWRDLKYKGPISANKETKVEGAE